LGNSYTGDWCEGKRKGFAHSKDIEGNCYVGEFKDNLYYGNVSNHTKSRGRWLLLMEKCIQGTLWVDSSGEKANWYIQTGISILECSLKINNMEKEFWQRQTSQNKREFGKTGSCKYLSEMMEM
jgi:hypothetical protein